ncbi:MAG: histidine phosphatase family protein [Pseudomonadota bacterium]
MVARGDIARIMASDMDRAWTTASIVGAALGVPVTKEILLRERWFGDLVGTSSANLDWSHDPPQRRHARRFHRPHPRRRAGRARQATPTP